MIFHTNSVDVRFSGQIYLTSSVYLGTKAGFTY